MSHSLKEEKLLLISLHESLSFSIWSECSSTFQAHTTQSLKTTSVTSRDGRGAIPSFMVDLYYHMSPGRALGLFFDSADSTPSLSGLLAPW